MDLSKLAPAPWTSDGCYVHGPVVVGDGDVPDYSSMTIYDEGGHNEDEAKFIALARNAFDVMMRRGWYAVTRGDEWTVPFCLAEEDAGFPWKAYESVTGKEASWPDPFTALVEADRWYRENVEHG
jgi:hypothetical protein